MYKYTPPDAVSRRLGKKISVFFRGTDRYGWIRIDTDGYGWVRIGSSYAKATEDKTKRGWEILTRLQYQGFRRRTARGRGTASRRLAFRARCAGGRGAAGGNWAALPSVPRPPRCAAAEILLQYRIKVSVFFLCGLEIVSTLCYLTR